MHLSHSFGFEHSLGDCLRINYTCNFSHRKYLGSNVWLQGLVLTLLENREEMRQILASKLLIIKCILPSTQHTPEFVQKVAIACTREMEALRPFINSGLPYWVILMMNACSLHKSAVQLLLSNSSRWSFSAAAGMWEVMVNQSVWKRPWLGWERGNMEESFSLSSPWI